MTSVRASTPLNAHARALTSLRNWVGTSRKLSDVSRARTSTVRTAGVIVYDALFLALPRTRKRWLSPPMAGS
jgi:hypothetical protein